MRDQGFLPPPPRRGLRDHGLYLAHKETTLTGIHPFAFITQVLPIWRPVGTYLPQGNWKILYVKIAQNRFTLDNHQHEHTTSQFNGTISDNTLQETMLLAFLFALFRRAVQWNVLLIAMQLHSTGIIECTHTLQGVHMV